MARYLHVKAGIVVNVVDYGTQTPPDVTDAGEDVAPDPTGTTSVGDPFDVATYRNTAARAPAAACYDGTGAEAKALRALAGVLVDELNALRQWVTSFKAACAAATSFADQKTRIAALANVPDRTLAQAKTAIQNKVNAGAVDA